MASMSLYLREQLLRSAFRGEPVQTTAYLALTTVAPVSDQDGESLVEPGSNYVRARYDLVPANWEVSPQAEAVSALDVSYPAAAAPWGLLQGWALVTAPTAGLLLASGRLTVPYRVDTNTQVVVPKGTFVFTLDDFGG